MSGEIPFVTMKWSSNAEKREHRQFTSAHVNAVLDMLRKTQTRHVRLICVTDDPSGLDPAIEAMPIPERGLAMANEYRGCWTKLYLFSKEFRDKVGAKFIYSDLDVAILADMSGPYDRSEPLVIMEGRLAPLFVKIENLIGGSAPRGFRPEVLLKLIASKSLVHAWHYPKVAANRWCRFNGTFMIVDKDQPDDLWADLDVAAAIEEVRDANLMGTDQAWLQLHKHGEIHTLGKKDGFWFKRDVEDYYSIRRRLPPGLRLINFAGAKSNPWSSVMQRHSWVRKVYPELRAA